MAMPAPQTAAARPRGLALGAVTLSVGDLARAARFYREAIGLALLSDAPNEAVLGVGETPLLRLVARPGARPAPRGASGLFHVAFLLPTRADLARFLRHAAEARLPIEGASDHAVSEALYLSDPDGHGIEVYVDRPADAWPREGEGVGMTTARLDVEALLREAGPTPWRVAPEGTRIGHVHLKVGDLEETEAFYRGVLGLDVTHRRPGALFFSAAGYHHHIGTNTWASLGGGQPGAEHARLERVTLRYPDPADRAAAIAAARRAGYAVREEPGVALVSDPAGNPLALA